MFMDAPEIVSFEQFEAETLALIKPPFRSLFNAKWFHEISKTKPKRDWLVKGLILAKTFGIIFGAPGSGKSFLTTDLFLHCAALAEGRPQAWFGYRLRRFGVIYLTAEGSDDFEIRLHAWRAEQGIAEDTVLPFVFLPTSIDLRSNEADTLKLVDEIKGLSAAMLEKTGVEVAVIVIDTVARALAGGNENASDVMGAFIINCGKLQEKTGIAVLGVHHGGKEAGRGPRGHEGLHGAADFEVEVSGALESVSNAWAVRKLKAGPAGASHKFKLKAISLDKDEEGDAVTSCVVVPLDKAEQEAQQIETRKRRGHTLNKGEQEFLKAFEMALDAHGMMPPPGLEVGDNVTRIAAIEDVRAEFRERFSATETGEERQIEQRLRARWSRAVKGLLHFNIIRTNKVYVWMTGKPLANGRIRGAIEWPERSPEPPPHQVVPPSRDDGEPL